MTNISRRYFLEQSMLSLATTGAAVYTANLMGVPSTHAIERPVGTNDRIGVMVVGCGSRGNGHIKDLAKMKGVEILYLCDADRSQAEIAAKRLEEINGAKPKLIQDMREALGDKNLHALSCASPNHWHALVGIWGMQAGLHCYLEKPISHNVHEGQALIAAAKKYGLCCQTGTQNRSNQANIAAVEYVRAGHLGDVRFSRGLCYKRRKAIGPKGDYQVPESVDYNLWSGPAPVLPMTRQKLHYNWHWQRLYGNADLGNQGPHQIDVACWHLGIERLPNKVLAYGGRLGYDVEKKSSDYIDAGDTANTIVTICDYGDKMMVFETRGLETSGYQQSKLPESAAPLIGVVSYGSQGYLVQVKGDYSAAFDREGKLVQEFKGGGDHFKNFFDAVRANAPSQLNSDAKCGHVAASVSHLGNMSYYLGEANHVSLQDAKKMVVTMRADDDHVETLERTVEHLQANGVDLARTPIAMGEVITLDSKTEKIINNAKATAMLTRDYRKGFVVPTPDAV